jgi:hypothetical protein
MARRSNNSALNVVADKINASGLLGNLLSKEVTFVAATTGKQATGTFTIATVTGTVALNCFAVNTGAAVLTGAASTIEVGTALSTAGILPQKTCTTWDPKLILQNTTLGTSLELSSSIKTFIVTQDVAYKIGTADITGGTVTFYILWTPISPNGNVVLA